VTQGQTTYDVIHTWKQVDFDWKTDTERQEQIRSKTFIPENNVISGIKAHGDKLYLTVPRGLRGVPSTLNCLPYNRQQQRMTGQKLQPFPSWEMNKLGNCDALQNVQSMEIDQYGRMWVLDIGRVHIHDDQPDNKCPPKLVLIDLSTKNIVKTHVFPQGVVSPTNNYLNDIVVGCTSQQDCWAYMTDAKDFKIIAYNLQMDKSWFMQHEGSMKPQDEAKQITIQGKTYTFESGVNGIALSPFNSHFNTLYYSPLSSYHLYKIDMGTIRDQLKQLGQPGMQLQANQVHDLGRKPSQSNGMTMDAQGMLYFGALGKNAVYRWDTHQTSLTEENQHLLFKHDQEVQWPDSFHIDDNCDLLLTTNRLHLFQAKTVDFGEINMRVLRFSIGQRNYMHPAQAQRGAGQC
jgi:sugar lactone lactonase YvrE